MIHSTRFRSSTFAVLSVAALTLAGSCSGGGGGSSGQATPGQFVASGELQISGADTSAIGDVLTIGDVARVNGPGSVRTYYCLDAGSRVSGFEYDAGQTPGGVFDNTTLGDPLNAFVINVIDDVAATGLTAISMTVIRQGVNYDFTCSFCAGLSFDDAQQTITFDDVEVDPTGASTGVLTINGTIAWGLPQ